ncbi:glycosyltransferase family 4 protein [Candidatus Contendibacter odensensis]|uniref:Glycosyl transferase group 1 n=1 Tax=Candidatus Contendobacter odensis Run_B_J11 TaxID=1400861 RepID=A0A7U7G8E2_9GAMM|nr:glycosyltransferase family 4 protein [Candidatus Contendobacter odensis]CDH43067.1 putative Glycosyl transferase group 1 [Candidatus Contendobacter odensis Run_B_J11]
MKTNNKSVLFITHDASATGAPIILLSFLCWLKKNSDISFQILICKRGKLDQEFESVAPVWYLDDRSGLKARLRSLFRMLPFNKSRFVSYRDVATRIRAKMNIDLIYSNTVANGKILEALSLIDCPVITHIHELEFAIRIYAGEDFKYIKQHTDYFIVVANELQKNLTQKHNISHKKIECIYGFIPNIIQKKIDRSTSKKALTQEIGLPNEARIIGGCGTVDWRKGCDLFIQLALAIKLCKPSFAVHFVWIGSKPSGAALLQLQYDIEHAELTDCVHFIGTRTNPLDYLAAFDVFALTSREDPFPLVMMEAASLEVPIVCFDRSGGGREFVQEDAGFVVPYLNILAMADRIMNLLHDEQKRKKLGAQAKEKVRKQHDINIVAPHILIRIEQMLKNA